MSHPLNLDNVNSIINKVNDSIITDANTIGIV